MVQEGRIAGRAMLFAGPPSTGKTAIALGELHSYPTPHLLTLVRHGAESWFRCPLYNDCGERGFLVVFVQNGGSNASVLTKYASKKRRNLLKERSWRYKLTEV